MQFDEVSEDDLLFLKENFYDSFKNAFYGKSKSSMVKSTNSIFIDLLKKDPTPVQKIIKENGVSVDSSFPLQSLLSKKLIILSFNQKDYIISPLGIWLVESRLNALNEMDIVNFLQTKFFNSGITERLDSNEKVALLSLISIGAFHEETPLDRKNGSFSSSQLSQILIDSMNFLRSEDIILDCPKLRADSEDEIVDYMFRRLPNLAKKTGHLYQFNGQRHWIQLYDKSSNFFDSKSLSFLLWKIFGENLDLDQQKRIEKFCQKISIQYLYDIFNEKQILVHLYHVGGYENSISIALFDILKLSDTWE